MSSYFQDINRRLANKQASKHASKQTSRQAGKQGEKNYSKDNLKKNWCHIDNKKAEFIPPKITELD